MFLVEQVVTRKIITVGADTLATAGAKMKAGEFRRLPVVDANHLIGIVSEFDLKRHAEASDSTLVENAMTRDPVTAIALGNAGACCAARLMREAEVGALPMIFGGKLVGIVTAKDLMMPEPRSLPEWDPRNRR